ncbi:AraC family transcriptional regulator [Legionella hackeliae]|uniref:Transcriptional regulator, AraC-family n=2 Tax=Legionella hackeliae TaxID=449 RepID=A0A0A8UTY4_LEGHA
MSNSLSLRSYTSETHTHSHDFAQLVLPLRGQLELEIGGKSGIVNEATGAYIHSNTQHCFASGEDNLFLVVDFLNTSANWNCHHMPSFMQLNAPLKNYLAFAHSYLGSHSNPQTDSLLYQLLINLLTSELTTPDRCVIQVKLWIEQHLATPIDIGHLAKQCHISKSQLQRRFKQNTGFSVAQYCSTAVMPLATVILAWIILGEQLTVWQCVGMGLVLLSIVIYAKK